MSVQNTRRNSAYGLTDALVNVFPAPIVARRVPTTHDMAQVGTLWVDALNNNAYVLTSVHANSATWVTFSQGAATFSSLTVTPGPTSLTGAVTIATANSAFALTTGTGTVNISTDATDNSVNIGTGAGEKNITIGNAVDLTVVAVTASELTLTGGDGGITLSVADSFINLESGTGEINIGADAVAHDITIGNEVGTTSVSIEAGSGGVIFLSDGIIAVSPIGATAASPTQGVTINANVGSATYTGYTTAAGASQAFVVSNVLCTATSKLLVTANNTGSNDAQITVMRVDPSLGSFNITVKNNGAAALNGDIYINFWLLD